MKGSPTARLAQRPAPFSGVMEAEAWIGPPSLCAMTEAAPFGVKPWRGMVQLTADWPSAYPARPLPNDRLFPPASRSESAEIRSRRSPLLWAVSVILSPLGATRPLYGRVLFVRSPKNTGME